MSKRLAIILLGLWALLSLQSNATAASSDKDGKSFLNVRYIRNYDGDSITFDIPEAPSIVGKDMIIRVRGIDTPELRKSKCQAEKNRALQAKSRVQSLLQGALVINLRQTGRGKYFRILADVEFDGKDLASLLLEENLAVKYFGGTKNHNWCNGNYSTPMPIHRTPSTLPPLVDGIYVWPPPPTQFD